jgi:hypothetical protein
LVTREDVLERLRKGHSYARIGVELGIPAGQAYMIATGIPADGSDSLAPSDFTREEIQLGGAQALIGVPARNPTEPHSKPEILEWVRRRATTELSRSRRKED